MSFIEKSSFLFVSVAHLWCTWQMNGALSNTHNYYKGHTAGNESF